MIFKQQYLLCNVCQTHSLLSGLVDGVCVACPVCLNSVTKRDLVVFSCDLIYVAGCFLSQCISVNVFQMDIAHYPEAYFSHNTRIGGGRHLNKRI